MSGKGLFSVAIVTQTTAMASGSTGMQARSSATAGNSFSLTQGAGSASRRHSGSSFGVNRIFCPVIGCPESLTSSNRHFRDLNSIRNHLNDHCTGHLSGAIHRSSEGTLRILKSAEEMVSTTIKYTS